MELVVYEGGESAPPKQASQSAVQLFTLAVLVLDLL